MNSYTIGTYFGRLFVAYLLVWIVLFATTRDWRAAFRRTYRWYGVLSVLVVFVLGIAISAARLSQQ